MSKDQLSKSRVNPDPARLGNLNSSIENEEKDGSPMLTQHLFYQIRRLREEGLGPVAIARLLKIDRKTASKYLNSNSPPRYKSREVSTRIDPLEKYDAEIRGLLEKCGTLSAQEIFEIILSHGYTGCERTVDRRVVKIRGEKPKERFFEQEYVPGEQAQFDFKEKVEIPFVDGVKNSYLHFGTLPHSDICFIRGYPFKNYECFIDGTISFFESIGGKTESIRIDNLSPCVLKVLNGDKRIYTKSFNRAKDHFDFKVLPCRVAKGSDKGDVERDIRTNARRIQNLIKLEGITFRDWMHFNQWLNEFSRNRHTEDQKKRFLIEQKTLEPLAKREDEVMCRIEQSPATLHGTVRISKSVYSVPDTAIGVMCRTIMGPFEVNVYQMNGPIKLIATHPVQADGKPSILLEHILPSLLRKPAAMIRWAHKELLFPSEAVRKYYKRLKQLDPNHAEREFLRSINLVQYTPMSEIIAGMELVLESDLKSVESKDLFESLKTLLLGERRPAEVIDICTRLGQRPLKPELSKYDEFIPIEGKPPDDKNRNEVNKNDSRGTDASVEDVKASSDGHPVRRSGTTG